MTKPKPYPAWVCAPCGMKYGRRRPTKYATWHLDKCGVCGHWAHVTEPRDFGHLELPMDEKAKKERQTR